MLKTYLIGLLPITANDDNKFPLEIVYQTDDQKGIWRYGGRDLSLFFERTETTLTNTNPEGRRQTKKRSQANQIDCYEWVSKFGDWYLDENSLYRHSGQVLCKTETERKWLFCSGFNFDLVSKQWFCEWEYQDNHDFLNSAHEYNLKIQLRLNFLTLTGYYIEQHYTDAMG